MTQWEYLVRAIEADKEEEPVINYVQREYVEQSWKEMPKYDLLAIEAHLAALGKEGWELISFETVDRVGKNGDIGLIFQNGMPAYRRIFLCVFKRPKE